MATTTLKVNILSTLKDRDWQSGLKKHDPAVWYLQEIHFKYNDIGRLKVKGF